MGDFCHHALVVTGPNPAIIEAHDHVRQLDTEIIPKIETPGRVFLPVSMRLSDVVWSPVNHFGTFTVVPDGSSEGRDASDKGNKARDAVVAVLKSYPVDWVEVQYGGEYGQDALLRGNNIPEESWDPL